jgi:hypothetical protein
MAGAVGEGRLDALAGGVPGVIFGAWLFAVFYPNLPPSLLEWGDVGDSTFPQVLKRTPWVIVLPASLLLTGLLVLLERGGM